MKTNRYESYNLFVFLSIILIFLEIVFLFYLVNKKIVLYQKMQGVIEGENRVSFLVDKKELRYFYNNKTIYVDDVKSRFKIIEVNNNVLKKDNVTYHEVLIEVKISSKYKINDILEISILNKKVKIISMFKIIWEEEY